MANAVFYHREDTEYDDIPEKRYHFPKSYLSRVEQTIGDNIVYYGPINNQPCYWATALVSEVTQDDRRPDHYFAHIIDYIDFDRRVPYKENGGYEKKLFLPNGRVNGGRAVQAIRIVEQMEFAAIVEAGLSQPDDWPDRSDDIFEVEYPSGFGHNPQAEFDRPIVEQLLKRPFRDAKFKQSIRKAYDRTCAFTGLRLINGKGRPEVEAAHIMPVHKNGPDSIRNGIALSGTVHWMFDRGLLSLADDFTILKSRQLNHDVSHILLPGMKALVPQNPNYQPHPFYLDWHRQNCFKS
ncbi:MAG: HNH endonuclease [Rhizobiales bacterium]|nr:HNH endonuclease [Hyphomicrobiales bacterium]